MSRVFIDTNILVYAVDRHDLKKQRICRHFLERLNDDEAGVISTQVIQEFYVTITQKLGLKPLEAKRMAGALDNFEIVQVDPDLIKEAIDVSILSQISFWDALIIAAAQAAKCDRIWSEDLSHHQTFKMVKIENIFFLK